MNPPFRVLLLIALAGIPARLPAAVSAEDVAVLRAALAPACKSTDAGYLLISAPSLEVVENGLVPDGWGTDSKLLGKRLAERSRTRASWSVNRICDKVLSRGDGDPRRLLGGPGNGETGWKKFYHAYPGARGFLAASLPAYSDDGLRAVISIEISCGFWCGGGEIVELEKKDGTWRRGRDHTTWVA